MTGRTPFWRVTRAVAVAVVLVSAVTVLLRPRVPAPTEAVAPWVAAQMSRSAWRVARPDGRRLSLYRHDVAWAGRFVCAFRRDETPYSRSPRPSPFAPPPDDYYLCLIDLALDDGTKVAAVVRLFLRPGQNPPYALFASDPAETIALLARHGQPRP
jgi:hypothetical protein